MEFTQKENQKKVNAFEDVTIIMRNLYEKKNMDYGDSFSKSFAKWGLPMSCIRLGDKLNRLESFAKGKEMQVADESVVDTLMDLANYAIMTILEIQNKQEEKKNG